VEGAKKLNLYDLMYGGPDPLEKDMTGKSEAQFEETNESREIISDEGIPEEEK
jgi:hypothetical protein